MKTKNMLITFFYFCFNVQFYRRRGYSGPVVRKDLAGAVGFFLKMKHKSVGKKLWEIFVMSKCGYIEVARNIVWTICLTALVCVPEITVSSL